MARIRTVKPEVAQHELLYQLEQELQANVRFAWVMLPSQADREGRFKWRPAPLKLGCLPYDKIDFSRVLDAWLTRGMLVKYRVKNEWYGWIPTWKKHQQVNNREAVSELPAFDKADEVIDYRDQALTDACSTREDRVLDATQQSASRVPDATRGEGKGREGERGRVDDASIDLPLDGAEAEPEDAVPGLDEAAWSRWLTYRREVKKPLKPASVLAARRELASFGPDQTAVVEKSIAAGWQGLFPLKANGTGGGGDKPKEGTHARGLPCLNP